MRDGFGPARRTDGEVRAGEEPRAGPNRRHFVKQFTELSLLLHFQSHGLPPEITSKMILALSPLTKNTLYDDVTITFLNSRACL